MKSSFLLPAVLHALCISVAAAPAPYLVTSYAEESLVTYPGYIEVGYTTEAQSVYTVTQEIVPTVTPIPSAITTYTQKPEYTHLTVIQVILPPGSGTEPTIDYAAYSTSIYTSYVVPITYSKPDSCTGANWTYTTNVPVWIPQAVETQLAPVTVSASATTYSYDHLVPTPVTVMIAVLNPTDVNADDLASASSSYIPYQVKLCESPTTECSQALCTSDSSPSDTGPSQYDDSYYNSYVRQLIIIAVCVPVGWILLWLILGMWENWASFKGIMLGQQRKRGVPYSWCCVNIIFLCFTGPTYMAKSEEEQAALLERWKEMKAGQKFKLWMRWGFKWKYPDMLGPEPEMRHRAMRQACL